MDVRPLIAAAALIGLAACAATFDADTTGNVQPVQMHVCDNHRGFLALIPGVPRDEYSSHPAAAVCGDHTAWEFRD